MVIFGEKEVILGDGKGKGRSQLPPQVVSSSKVAEKSTGRRSSGHKEGEGEEEEEEEEREGSWWW